MVLSGSLLDGRAYAVNGLNQYTAVGGAGYQYDANGNLTWDGANSYVYDAENRLVSSSLSGGTTLSYDPLGRLWQTSSAGHGTTRFLYEGDRLAVEYNTAGAVLRRHLWGDGVDQPIVQAEGPALDCSTARFLHADHQGSIVATATCGGTRGTVIGYDEYGVSNASNSPSAGRFSPRGR